MLRIVSKLSFIVYPLFVDLCEIMVVEGLGHFLGPIIKHSAKTTEFVILPISLIGHLAILIVKFPVPMHFIVSPFPNIIPTIVELQLTFTIFHPIFHVTFISSTSLQHNNYIFLILLRNRCIHLFLT